MPTIKLDAAAKLLNTLLERITPALAVQAKHSYTSGYLQERATLFSTMYHEWSTLQKDTNDTMEAVSSLDWSVAPYVTPGAKPSARAKKVADTVAAAIWHVRQQAAGGYAHGFLDLVGAMLDGLYRGVSVHEIIWARDEQLVYPAEYRQVPAQFYIWETRPEHEDRLLLVRDGMSYSLAEPFPRDRFIIALNTTGSDHPLFNAIYHSLVSYFLAAKQGLPWMLEYCERYCHPSRVFTVRNKKDVPTLQAALAQSPIVTDIFLSKDMDAAVEVQPIPGGANIPHEALLRVAENACHQAILGQTLTSDTSENGGSRAQAEVHLGVQKSVVMQRAEYVARVLNRQLVPAIVAANFGRTEGIPMPEIKFAMPDDGANAERANYWGAVLSLPGISVPREHVYESLRIPMPAEGDDTLGAQNAPAAPPLLPKEQEENSKKNDEKLSAAKAAPPVNGLQLLTSMADSIAVLRYWRKRGLSSSYILEHLPELSAEYNSATAANPYGCNQYGEGWAEPHDGHSHEHNSPEPWQARQEEREHLEELLAELDRQEEAARDAESSGDSSLYDEEDARDRWSSLSREGDPQTREDIEKRLAELDAEDAAEENKDKRKGNPTEGAKKELLLNDEEKAAHLRVANDPNAAKLIDLVDNPGKYGSKTPVTFRAVTPNEAANLRNIAQAAGFELDPKEWPLEKYQHAVVEGRFRHALDGHEYTKKGAKRLDRRDLKLIPDIVNTPDKVTYKEENTSDGIKRSFVYKKRYGDKAYTYAENLLRPHRKHPSYLRMASAWLDIEPVAKAKKR